MLQYTGTQVNYYFVCPRKLWLFSNHIQMEHSSDTVYLGKLIGQESYDREKKEIRLDDTIAIDFLELKNNKIHEIKKSRAVEKAHTWQVKYYLYYLKQKGLKNITAEINYPILRKKIEIELTLQDEEDLNKIMQNIKQVTEQGKPPEKINKKFCRKCSYYALCWV